MSHPFSLYSFESWTLTAELHGKEVLPQDTTHLIQRPCYQRGSPCQDPAGNRTTRRPPDTVKRRKLQWDGHVFRLSGLAKTILQGTVKGVRRQGRQRKRWEDNNREWAGLEFAKSQRTVENKGNGGNWLRNHLWCPSDPRGKGIDEMRDEWDFSTTTKIIQQVN